ncbi:Cysteine-rich receptor-like protein kinase [Thalictrum thalictroides]|uniref:Cysteine-rich receptor-like protein kinase n=1 Tax=Thalictrum thalictroides TaxID=46969 RepID=A0A7J6VC58_THATH|nr:Cysteine-rich receptor-like protein kinase [Thalictrum thalictroides]
MASKEDDKEIVELEGTSIISNKQIREKSGVPYFDEIDDVDDDMYYTSDDGGKTLSPPPPEPLYFGKTPVFDQISEYYVSGEDEEEPDDINAFVETMEEEDKIQYDTVEEFFQIMIRKFDTSSHSFIWRCLLFWYVFPKNCEFYMEDIIHLWIAQGFIYSPLVEVMTMEDTACLWYKEFERMGVVEPSCLDSSTGRLRYKLNHSFVDTLQARPNINNHYSRLDDGKAYITENTLHVSLQDNFDPATLQDLYQAKGLFTLLILHKQGSRLDQVPRDLFLKLPLLRALDLSHTCITELPSSIGNLEDLRYLNLTGTPITTLPDSVCSLYQMQTLKLRGCLKLLRLPKGMHKLVNLRHLDVDVSCLLISMPPRFGNLVELQTLPAFIVSKENGCHITELKNLVNLHGSFRILRLENVSGLKEAREAALNQKKYIDKLEFHWTELQDGLEVLEYLQPHRQVKELQIVGYAGAKFPSWIGNPIFSILTTITIHDCRNCEVLPTLGKLLSLKTLCLSNMIAVKTIDSQFCGRDIVARVRDFVRFRGKRSASNTFVAFRILETLTFKSLLSLEEWSGMKELDFPHLENLNISDCPRLTALPEISLLKDLKKLEISFCPSLKSLPNKGLPRSLLHLVITDCPILKGRCQKDKGEDWRKIVHIPDLWIDYQHISRAQPSPTTGLVPLPSQSLKSITVPMLSTSNVDNSKDASDDLMFKPHGDPTENLNEDQEKNNRGTTAPSKPKSFLSNLILNPFTTFSLKGATTPSDPFQFPYRTLLSATNGFHLNSKLGSGGFGSVYKGILEENGKMIAVKRLSQSSNLGTREFMNEATLLTHLQHKNVVKLLGYCINGTERLLVYEYLSRPGLDMYLFDSKRREELQWKRRYDIIVGLARGLLYLHEESHVRIIHRNISARNILFDEMWTPKIAGVGMMNLIFQDDQTHETTSIVGTLGYIAPEYANYGNLSTKADVYSFGIVVLEVISGQRNSHYNINRDVGNLLEWAWKLYTEGRSSEMIDAVIAREKATMEQVYMCINIGLLCVQPEPELRPSMGQVLLMLSQQSTIPEVPTKPVYSLGLASPSSSTAESGSAFSKTDGFSSVPGAWKLYTEGRSSEMIDAVIAREKATMEQVYMCINIGLLCVQPEPELRPSMGQVLLMLSQQSTIPEVPTKFVYSLGLASPSSSTAESATILVPGSENHHVEEISGLNVPVNDTDMEI